MRNDGLIFRLVFVSKILNHNKNKANRLNAISKTFNESAYRTLQDLRWMRAQDNLGLVYHKNHPWISNKYLMPSPYCTECINVNSNPLIFIINSTITVFYEPRTLKGISICRIGNNLNFWPSSWLRTCERYWWTKNYQCELAFICKSCRKIRHYSAVMECL